jgi:hypothetical protein
MNIYKITNITDKLGKRDNNYNNILKISYVDEMVKKNIELKPNNTIYFKANSLPLSVQKFKIKNLVSVNEISEKEFNDIKQNKKTKQKSTTTTTSTTKKPKKSSYKKSTTKKSSYKKSTTKKSSSNSKSTTTSTNKIGDYNEKDFE